MRYRKRQMLITVALLVIGLVWFGYAIVHQARLDKALIRAIQAGNTATALSALHSGANPNAHEYGKSDGSLWEPIKQRFRKLFSRHAPHEADLLPSALALAVHSENSTVVSALLDRGANGVNDHLDFPHRGRMIDSDVADVHLPLLLGAAQNGDVEIVKGLLDHGADVNATDEVGNNALLLCLRAYPIDRLYEGTSGMAAAERERARYAAAARMLIDRGINVRKKNFVATDKAIYLAAEDRLPEIVDLVWERGADLDDGRGHHKKPPLHYAAFIHKVLKARELLDGGATVESPYDLSPQQIEAGGKETVRLLLESKGDPNARSGAYTDRATALISDARDNDLASVILLLSRGAKVNARDNNGYTALMWAAQYADNACVQTLLEHGADVNARGKNGETPLMKAAEDGRDNNISALLSHGAGVNLRNRYGETALILAAGDGNDEAVRSLLDAGASINLLTNNGNTALDVAIAENNSAGIALLKKHGARRSRPFIVQ